MAVSSLPPIADLALLPHPEQLQIIDTLFEPSDNLHKLILPILSSGTPSPSYDHLIDTIHGRLTALSKINDPSQRQVLYGILGSHPHLGAVSPASQAGLSELSRREQANINSSSSQDQDQDQESIAAAAEQAERLGALNREYEETYPGLRYVTFVNGRGRDVIMVDMRRRIDRGDFEQEVRDNIEAMCDIAKDRAKKLQASS